MSDDPLTAAVAEIALGASLADVWRECLARLLRTPGDARLDDELARLAPVRRRELETQATRFTGQVCRRLGDRYPHDVRACHALEEWVRRSGDYDAYDALLGNFDFPDRPRVLAEARRRFPRALTAHWE